MSNLLVICPTALGMEANSILNSAVDYVESYAGKWTSVEVVVAKGSLIAMAKAAEADHVLLLGSRLANTLPMPSGTTLRGYQMYGILMGAKSRRWVATPHPEQYGTGETATVGGGNLIGHLVRHLELLKWGYAGWKDVGAPVRTRMVSDATSAKKFMREIEDAPVVAIDTETTDLRRIGNSLLTLQMGTNGDSCWVLPIGHPDSELEPRVLKHVRAWLKEYLERGNRATHIYANGAFDIHQFKSWLDLDWYNHLVWDLEYAEFSLDENREGRKQLGYVDRGAMWGLEKICQEYGLFHYSSSPVSKNDRARLSSLPLKDVATYGALDGALPIRVRAMEIELAKRRNAGMRDKPYTNFVENITLVEGVKVLQMCEMEHNGLYIDRKYVASLASPDSPFQKEVKAAEQRWNALPDVIEANTRLMKNSNVIGKTLFGDKKRTALQISKPAHQQMLFFEVAGLTPLKFGQNGASVDANFKKANRHAPIIIEFRDLEEAQKLYGTFIVGYNYVLCNNPDCKDGRLKTRFDGKATTSRLKSSDPNLQNVPSRSARAKMVKRQFVSVRGRLYRKRDFSAHEVRVLGITAKDPAMAERFWVGMQTRMRYAFEWEIAKEKEAWWAGELAGADVHNQNYGILYGVDPKSVSKEQRGGVKTTIFATSYGKSLRTLASDLQRENEVRLEDLLDKSTKAGDRNSINNIEQEMEEARVRDWLQYATDLFDLIFRKKFRKAGEWLDYIQKEGAKTTHAKNIFGGVRHLYGYLHPARHVRAACNRRGPNSSIQGPSSNLGLLGAYHTRLLVWKWFVSRGVRIDNVQCNAVHDSTESETSIVQIPLMNYLEHHGFTTMNHRFIKRISGEAPNVGLESDVEVGPSLSNTKKADRWDKELDAIQKGIEWGNDNLGWNLPVEKLMRATRHNAIIIQKLRRQEIRKQLLDGERTNMWMAMNADNALKLGLIFEVDIGEDRKEVKKLERAKPTKDRVDWREEIAA
jgi:DNA polymerase I-like protein with 3'-5' exonuclease and polymerase domains